MTISPWLQLVLGSRPSLINWSWCLPLVNIVLTMTKVSWSRCHMVTTNRRRKLGILLIPRFFFLWHYSLSSPLRSHFCYLWEDKTTLIISSIRLFCFKFALAKRKFRSFCFIDSISQLIFYVFRMKDSNSSMESRQGLEGYVNHGLSGSTNNVDLIHSFQSLHNSHGNHRDIQGSSDFICKF